jgi:hypothetical protein
MVTDCLLRGLGMILKRLWSWLRTCSRGERILLADLLGIGGSFLAKFILVFITFSNSISIDKKQLGANKLKNGLNK